MNTNPKPSLKFLQSPKSYVPSHKSSLSENRYNSSSEEPEASHPLQEFSLKEIFDKKQITHSRVLSQPIDMLTPEVLFGHNRRKSLGPRPLGQLYDTSQASTPKLDYFDKENEWENEKAKGKYTEKDKDKGRYKEREKYFESEYDKCHSRKVSDFDIVVFGDRDPGTSNDIVKRSLPVFGRYPCSAYCKDCDREVHTRVEFLKKNAIAFSFMEIVSSIFACCGEPAWMLKLRVHKCEECGKVLARSCK